MILSKAKKSIDFNVQLLLCLEKFVRKSENLCGILFLIKNISRKYTFTNPTLAVSPHILSSALIASLQEGIDQALKFVVDIC